jgi:hypothetical protein
MKKFGTYCQEADTLTLEVRSNIARENRRYDLLACQNRDTL